MSIPFTLEGAVEKYNALFTEEGYNQTALEEVYTLIAKTKEKGYRILGAAIYANTEDFINGKWVYHREGIWEHVGKGYACKVAILGGFNGDDFVGSELIYYPENGTPERVF